MSFKSNFYKKGQSLIEVLVAVVVGMILIGGVIMIIAPTLKISAETNESKIGAALGRELVEKVRVFASANWHNIDALATGTSNIFHLTSTAVTFATSSGAEQIMVSTTTYTRYFYLEDVCRDNNNRVSSSPPCSGLLEDDPSTKKVTIIYKWPMSATNTFSTLLTRHTSRSIRQTIWSTVSNPWGIVTSSFQGFVSSSNLSFASSVGSVVISNIVY